jgi:hypothetical protein
MVTIPELVGCLKRSQPFVVARQAPGRSALAFAAAHAAVCFAMFDR